MTEPNARDKRPADTTTTTTTPELCTKRPRHNSHGLPSLRHYLTIPSMVIFFQPPSQNRVWLSRTEAQAFVRNNQLAIQVDALAELSRTVLSKQHWLTSFQNKLVNADHPYLRCLQPILSVQQSTLQRTLQDIQLDLTRIFDEWTALKTTLVQFSEHNFDLSTALCDSSSTTANVPPPLAIQKRALSDLQDELVQRLTIVMNEQGTVSQSTTCMADYCQTILARLGEEANDHEQKTPAKASVDSEAADKSTLVDNNNDDTKSDVSMEDNSPAANDYNHRYGSETQQAAMSLFELSSTAPDKKKSPPPLNHPDDDTIEEFSQQESSSSQTSVQVTPQQPAARGSTTPKQQQQPPPDDATFVAQRLSDTVTKRPPRSEEKENVSSQSSSRQSSQQQRGGGTSPDDSLRGAEWLTRGRMDS